MMLQFEQAGGCPIVPALVKCRVEKSMYRVSCDVFNEVEDSTL